MPDTLPLALPTRPLTVRPPGMGVWSDFWSVLGTLFVALGCVVVVLFPLPALLSDYSVRETARPIENGHIEHGSCSTHLVLVSCEATLIIDSPGKPSLSRTLHYFFVDLHTGDYQAQVVADPSRPELVTTDLALDKMTNRVATMAIGGPLFLALALGALWMLFKALPRHRAMRRALSGQTLRPVLLRLDGVGPRGWAVSHFRPDGTVVVQKWGVGRKVRPIMMDPQRSAILGVTAGDGRVAMPLDQKLGWVKLSKEERRSLRDALGLA